MALALGDRCISVGHKTPITNATLLALSRAGVRYISTRSIGVQPHRRGLRGERRHLASRNVTYSPDSVADYTLMLMLMAVRHAKSIICRADIYDYRLHDVRGKELRDLTVGVIGTGRIGTAVLDRLRGFGCRVLTHDSRPRDARRTRSPRGAAAAQRHRDPPPPAHRGHPPSPGPPPDRAAEARGGRRQHRTRCAPRHRGPRVGTRERPAGRCGARRPRGRGRDLLRRPAGTGPSRTQRCCGCRRCRTCSSARTPPTTPTTP